MAIYETCVGFDFSIFLGEAPEKSVTKESSKRLRAPGWGYGYEDVQLSTTLPFCGDLMRKKTNIDVPISSMYCIFTDIWVILGKRWYNFDQFGTYSSTMERCG